MFDIWIEWVLVQFLVQMKKATSFSTYNPLILKWILRDLNPRPSDYESDALTN